MSVRDGMLAIVGTRDRQDLGRIGEDAALADYTARGYRSVARNWRCTLGEIDLVVARGSLLVVCEVKARRTRAFGGPFDAVTAAKQRKLRALAGAFLEATHSGLGQRPRGRPLGGPWTGVGPAGP
jgi:putative endonuclease